MPSKQKNQTLDPLFQLFEHYLLTKSYDDATKFTKEVATEYLNYLDSTPAFVPLYARGAVLEDLELEAHEMLVRKMYGCTTATDYSNSGTVMRVNWEEPLRPVSYQTRKTRVEETEK